MNSFYNVLTQYNWEEIKSEIYAKTEADVNNAIQSKQVDLDGFMALISPVAEPFLEQIATVSHQKTLKRFGNTIQLYIPLYLSNACDNYCKYCGFNHNNDIERVVLSDKEILQEAKVLKSYGYEHILLVTGESPKLAGFDYIKNALKLLKPYFKLISLEVQPLKQNQYKELIDLGLNTVYVYQETYNQESYAFYHPKGIKSNFKYRLETPDRLGKAGIHKIGLGHLIGLGDWRTDAFFTALHLRYLTKTYWQTKYSVSFPRLRPHAGQISPKTIMTDKQLVQLMGAYRFLDEEVEISLTTRETPKFRDNAIKLGVTSMSAGSKTEPGGYAINSHALKQFEESDNRTPQEIAKKIKQAGYEAVWKDWDSFMQLP